MKIVHFAPFAPHACGLYEAARDMAVADILAGHDTFLVDVGLIGSDPFVPGDPDKIDARGDVEIITASPDTALDADIIIAHTGMQDGWVVRCQAPFIWALHGRPTACFCPEQFGRGNTYSLIATLASWPRVKAMVTFWPHHVKFWEPIIPKNKLVCLPAPPVDISRFKPVGKTHDYTIQGSEFNIALADSWREDINIYEIIHGAIQYAEANEDVKFHFYGMEDPLRGWEFVINKLRVLGGLGEVWGRRPGMDEVYRSVDIVLSPHRIATRVICEALTCGTPVIAAEGCEYAMWTCNPSDPDSVASTIKIAINELKENKLAVEERVKVASEAFSLSKYSESMNTLYNRILQ